MKYVAVASDREMCDLFGIQMFQVHAVVVIPLRESKSMRRRHIFSLLDCRKCNGIVHGSRMAIDSMANHWL